jgi:hypothetical protein
MEGLEQEKRDTAAPTGQDPEIVNGRIEARHTGLASLEGPPCGPLGNGWPDCLSTDSGESALDNRGLGGWPISRKDLREWQNRP